MSRLLGMNTVILRMTVEFYGAAQIVLIICWVLWAWPFFAYKARTPKRPAQVTVTSSRWGIALQMIGFFLAWIRLSAPRPWPLLAAALLLAFLAVILSWTGVHTLGKQLRVHAGL